MSIKEIAMPARLESPTFALRGLVYPHNLVWCCASLSLRNQNSHLGTVVVTQLLQPAKPGPESLDQRGGWTMWVVSVVWADHYADSSFLSWLFCQNHFSRCLSCSFSKLAFFYASTFLDQIKIQMETPFLVFHSLRSAPSSDLPPYLSALRVPLGFSVTLSLATHHLSPSSPFPLPAALSPEQT